MFARKVNRRCPVSREGCLDGPDMNGQAVHAPRFSMHLRYCRVRRSQLRSKTWPGRKVLQPVSARMRRTADSATLVVYRKAFRCSSRHVGAVLAMCKPAASCELQQKIVFLQVVQKSQQHTVDHFLSHVDRRMGRGQKNHEELYPCVHIVLVSILLQ